MTSTLAERSEEIAIWNRGFSQTIGGALPLNLEHVAADRVVMTMQVDHRTHQPMGVLHGGASLVPAESAASTGANLACPPSMVAVGQEINANHLRPKTEGLVRATALPLHIGRTTQVWSVEIRDEAGKLVCVSRCTLAVVPTPPGLATPRERGLMARRCGMTRAARLSATTSREMKRLRLLCIVAHPDDESLGLGGILAKYAAEGTETYLVTATRGERGWFGLPEENPGATALGQLRGRELRDAASVLGVHEMVLLDYHDGELDTVDQSELVQQLVGELRRIRPDVVVTFDHNGVYGHPDHIAVTRATTAAVVAAADLNFCGDTSSAPHAVSKLYYFAWTQEVREAYERAFGELRMYVNGVERRAVPWSHWTISTWIDTSAHWERVWGAIRCHRSQLPGYQKLLDLPDEYHQTLWGQLTFHRVYTLVPTSPREDDLFDGLRDRVPPAGRAPELDLTSRVRSTLQPSQVDERRYT